MDLFDPDITFEMNLEYPYLLNYGISKEVFKISLKEYFLPKEFQYCKKSKIPYNIGILLVTKICIRKT